MFSPLPQLSESPNIQPDGSITASRRKFRPRAFDLTSGFGSGLRRRFARERRRRKVGRAYDMALEIARVIPRGSQVLDVGCGNGFIAHHLSALMGPAVIGIDVADSTEAPLEYRQFNGREFPVSDVSFDAIVLAYVLHHVQDVDAVLREISRVLRPGGMAVIYEDIPETFWDRFICWTHDRQWRERTGPCAFRNEAEWRRVFERAGFTIIRERQLARLRNLTHPVRRRFFLLRLQAEAEKASTGTAGAHTTNGSPLKVSLASVEVRQFPMPRSVSKRLRRWCASEQR